MASLSKKVVLMFLLILTVSVLVLVESCVAPVIMPTNPNPAPEIVSIVIHNDPMWRPPEYSTNSYTGEVTETVPGHWAWNGSIVVTIKNRPFTPYVDEKGNHINVYYSFFFQARNLNKPWSDYDRPILAVYQSDSDFTVVTFTYGAYAKPDIGLISASGGDLVYFHVQAVTGYFEPYFWVCEGVGSEWTDFTITMPVSDKPGTSTVKPPSTTRPGTTSTSDNHNNNSQQNPTPYNLLIILVSVCIIAILLLIIVYLLYSRQRKTKPTIVDGESSYVMNTNG